MGKTFFTASPVIDQDRAFYTGANRALEKLTYTEQPLLAGEFFDLIKQIRVGDLEDFDLPETLRDSAKPGVTLSEKRLRDYSICPIFSEPGLPGGPTTLCGIPTEEDPRGEIYLDTPFGIALFYKEDPNAVTAFLPTDFHTLKICQLQLINLKIYDQKGGHRIKRPRGLMPLDWKRVLVESVKYIGKRYGFERISIREGRKNKWANQGIDGTVHLELEDAFEIYDNTARRLGFTQEKDGDWSLSL